MSRSFVTFGFVTALLTASVPLGAGALAASLPAGWVCNGVCGTNNVADGVIGLAPGLSNYQWISTTGSPDGTGKLPVGATGQETNGSLARTPSFSVNAGDKLEFFFNYITSDGAQYTEYAWAGLYFGSGTFDGYLFTARTTTSGNTVPGFGLPGLGAGVTLTPTSTAIIPGGPTFSPLGTSSGTCYSTGCGYTGWIDMQYQFAVGGVYSLAFGVTNALDQAYDTAFAVAGVAINDLPIEPTPTPTPEPATLMLLSVALASLGLVRRRQVGRSR